MPGAGRQTGAAVILAILAVALVAMLASAAIADYGQAAASVSGRRDLAEARLLARAAADWARNILAQDARSSATDHLGEAWATHVPPTPAQEGEISGEIEDLSGRFDLNSLVKAGSIDAAALLRFRRLLLSLGCADDEASLLAVRLADWLDADDQAANSGLSEQTLYRGAGSPRLPANAPLADVGELSLILGYDAARVLQLRPYVTALPAAAPLNVNTAPAEVLVAELGSLDLESARLLVLQRQQAPFKDLADFQSRTGLTGLDTDRYGVASRYFLASVRARYGEAVTELLVMLDRQQPWPRILWQKFP